jgi:hypothetical protein
MLHANCRIPSPLGGIFPSIPGKYHANRKPQGALETEDTHIFGFTEVGRAAYNRCLGPAEAGRMVGISRKSGSRR